MAYTAVRVCFCPHYFALHARETSGLLEEEVHGLVLPLVQVNLICCYGNLWYEGKFSPEGQTVPAVLSISSAAIKTLISCGKVLTGTWSTR